MFWHTSPNQRGGAPRHTRRESVQTLTLLVPLSHLGALFRLHQTATQISRSKLGNTALKPSALRDFFLYQALGTEQVASNSMNVARRTVIRLPFGTLLPKTARTPSSARCGAYAPIFFAANGIYKASISNRSKSCFNDLHQQVREEKIDQAQMNLMLYKDHSAWATTAYLAPKKWTQ